MAADGFRRAWQAASVPTHLRESRWFLHGDYAMIQRAGFRRVTGRRPGTRRSALREPGPCPWPRCPWLLAPGPRCGRRTDWVCRGGTKPCWHWRAAKCRCRQPCEARCRDLTAGQW